MSETVTTERTVISMIHDLNGNELEIADAAARDAIENLPDTAITDAEILALFSSTQGGDS